MLETELVSIGKSDCAKCMLGNVHNEAYLDLVQSAVAFCRKQIMAEAVKYHPGEKDWAKVTLKTPSFDMGVGPRTRFIGCLENKSV
jgi:hypothetical protein